MIPCFGAIPCPLPFSPLGANSPSLTNAVFSLVFTVPFFLFGLGLVASAIDAGVNELELQRHGITTDAVVVSRHQELDEEGDRFTITYQFTPPQQGAARPTAYRNEVSVDRDTHDSLPPPRGVAIRYQPTNPVNSRLASNSAVVDIIALLGFSTIWLFVTGHGLGQAISCLHKLALLACCGQRVMGRIVDRWTDTSTEGDSRHCVAFSFPLACGDSQFAAEDNAKAFQRYQIHDLVLVRYVPNQPSLCRLNLGS